MTYQPMHEAFETDKLAALVADMNERGWVGGPLVADGDQLITGAHRYVAAKRADILHAVPVVDIRDIFAAADLDFDAIYADEDCGDWFETMRYAVANLPADVRADYGIDLH